MKTKRFKIGIEAQVTAKVTVTHDDMAEYARNDNELNGLDKDYTAKVVAERKLESLIQNQLAGTTLAGVSECEFEAVDLLELTEEENDDEA